MNIKLIFFACVWMISVQASEGRTPQVAVFDEAFKSWMESVGTGIKQTSDRQTVLDTAICQLNNNQQLLVEELNETRRAVGVLNNIKTPTSKINDLAVRGTCALIIAYIGWQVAMGSQCCPWPYSG